MNTRSNAFWQHKTLTELSTEEWELLCDGCARCCLHKLEDEDTGIIYYTNVACRLLDTDNCQCRDYQRRKVLIRDCVKLNANQPEILERYREELGDKLVVSGYIAREELLTVLSGMDFLINFDNNTTLNIPSKLIDYAIINRPVLNIDKNFNGEWILAFLDGDYSKRMQLPEPENYHIKSVTRLFMDLL